MKTVALPSGEQVPAFGQGTWFLGSNPNTRAEEVATLRLGLDLGLTLIDTAEIYGDGRSEELVAEAIGGRRDEAFLVSKVRPRNASLAGTVAACERSLKRLGTDRIDLYLLHWRGDVRLGETMQAFHALQRDGKIRHYGVSNFGCNDMQDLWSATGCNGVATNQVQYNLTHRGIERSLLPLLRAHDVPVMAHSPIQQSKLAEDPQLIEFARRHERTPTQIALAWLLAADDVIVIPRTSDRTRLRENMVALNRALTQAQLTELNGLFPPPMERQPPASP